MSEHLHARKHSFSPAIGFLFHKKIYFILTLKGVKISNRNLPPAISTSGPLFCVRHQADQTHFLFYTVLIRIIEFPLLRKR